MAAQTELLGHYDPGAADRRASAVGWLGRAVALAPVLLLVLVPPSHSGDWTNYAIFAAIYAMVGLSMNVLVGYTGQISLGQQAFVGIGALVAANLANAEAASADPFSFGLSIALGAVIAGAAALALGSIALRITGLYLALVTLVFGSVVSDVVLEINGL